MTTPNKDTYPVNTTHTHTHTHSSTPSVNAKAEGDASSSYNRDSLYNGDKTKLFFFLLKSRDSKQN